VEPLGQGYYALHEDLAIPRGAVHEMRVTRGINRDPDDIIQWTKTG